MSTNYDKESNHAYATKFRVKIRDEQARMLWSVVGVLLGSFLGLMGGALPYLHRGQILDLLEKFGWFLGLILLYHLLILLVFIAWQRRKRKTLEFVEQVYDVYLRALDQSSLNPHPQKDFQSQWHKSIPKN